MAALAVVVLIGAAFLAVSTRLDPVLLGAVAALSGGLVALAAVRGGRAGSPPPVANAMMRALPAPAPPPSATGRGDRLAP